jgi:hypothetical protein
MQVLPNLIMTSAMGYLALEIVPLYGALVSGLFGQVSAGLARVLAGI